MRLDEGRSCCRSLATIFLPLTPMVWVLHAVMMVFGGAVLLFIEATAAYVRRAADGDPSAGEGDGGDGDSPPHLCVNELLKSVYESLVHFLWNGPKHDPRTATGKLALFALSFHTLVIAASYTASLAGFLATSYSAPIEVPQPQRSRWRMPLLRNFRKTNAGMQEWTNAGMLEWTNAGRIKKY